MNFVNRFAFPLICHVSTSLRAVWQGRRRRKMKTDSWKEWTERDTNGEQKPWSEGERLTERQEDGRRSGIGSGTSSRVQVGEGGLGGDRLTRFIFHFCCANIIYLTPNNRPVVRRCMTEINQRAIVHTLPLMRSAIDICIRAGGEKERERGRERLGWKGEKCTQT